MLVKTIDLWLPNDDNRLETYEKAFRAGFDDTRAFSNKAIATSYDQIKIYINCNLAVNCSILRLDYQHAAILFFRNGQPVRLIIDDIPLESIKSCYNYAMVQRLGPNGRYSLQEAIKNLDVQIIDLGQKPLHSEMNHLNHVRLSSCDRWDLFLQLIDNLKEDQSKYSFTSTSTLEIRGSLDIVTDTINFAIKHQGIFYSTEAKHYIALQTNSPLTS